VKAATPMERDPGGLSRFEDDDLDRLLRSCVFSEETG